MWPLWSIYDGEMPMSQNAQQGGASVLARGQIPSTDLASLIQFLVKAYPPDLASTKPVIKWPVLTFDPEKRRLGINTYGILRRLVVQNELQAQFRQTTNTGFLRDLISPPKGCSSKLGGRLFDDNIAGLSQGLSKLKQLIENEINSLNCSVESLWVDAPSSALEALSDLAHCKSFLKEFPAQVVAMEFAQATRQKAVREKDIARVLSAQEAIQAEDWLERMTDSISNAQSHRDDEFNDVQRRRLVETLRNDFDKEDSQVTRFLNFLEDEALSRVRLRVSFAIMDSLAAQKSTSEKESDRRFINYIRRVNLLFQHYGAPESDHSLHFDLTREFGFGAEFSISQELAKAMFYNCLPVWAEWNTQLFESRGVDPESKGVSVVREVSYRFRVNGKDPLNGMEPAFNARLNRIQDILLNETDNELPQFLLRRHISEVLFLWLVLNPAIQDTDLLAEAARLAIRLKDQGKNTISVLLDELNSWSDAVKELSQTLVSILSTQSRNVVSHAQRSVDDLYLVVQQGVVDWSSIDRSKGRVRDPLIKPGSGQFENIEWLNHIKIARNPNDVISPLFSIRVRTTLQERTLTVSDSDSLKIQIRRELPEQLLNIVWRPIRVDENQPPIKPVPRVSIDKAWSMSSGIDIWYDPERLKFRNRSNLSEEDQRQYRAAAATAMTVLVYTVLQVISEKLVALTEKPFPALMVRFQEQGKNAAKDEGDHWVYAISQAVESALMRDIPVRMQGLVVDKSKTNDRKDPAYYKVSGAAYALSAAFPVFLETDQPSTINKVATIVYTTRPCDYHPGVHDTDGFIFQAKTYLAEWINQPTTGCRMAFDRMQNHVVENQKEFKSPKPIVEEVSRLQGLGYEHIILISNHFGNRRLNRTAQRHSPHTQTVFLDEVATKFPHVSLYMLRRDVFPAMRLHTRTKAESAFEAVQISDHDEFGLIPENAVQKKLTPIYTFATLAIVGGDDAARPQSGFCTYFWDEDYQVKSSEWRERVRSNLMNSTLGIRPSLLNMLRGLHFLEAEKQPDGGVFKPVLDPFGWVKPSTNEAAGEIEVLSSRRKGNVLLSLPALLSHVTECLHSR